MGWSRAPGRNSRNSGTHGKEGSEDDDVITIVVLRSVIF